MENEIMCKECGAGHGTCERQADGSCSCGHPAEAHVEVCADCKSDEHATAAHPTPTE